MADCGRCGVGLDHEALGRRTGAMERAERKRSPSREDGTKAREMSKASVGDQEFLEGARRRAKAMIIKKRTALRIMPRHKGWSRRRREDMKMTAADLLSAPVDPES